MANPNTIKQIVQLYQKLGGNLSEVLGTKTNINFLGKGKSPELMLDMDINTDVLGVLPRSKAVDELKNSVGYACLLYTSPSPRDATLSRMPSSA